jgi:type II restriction/modification system DNA methylase subunit YeeA
MCELLLYYLRERVDEKNTDLKYLAVTNIYEHFLFDAQEFERLFYADKQLIKEYRDFADDRKVSSNTDFFYKEIAPKYIEKVKDQIEFTYFDIRDYVKYLDTPNAVEGRKLIELYKLFSPTHLLKLSFQNDSNSLNKNFYNELLQIMGLEEVSEGGKKIIDRRKPKDRQEASLIENTITTLDTEDQLDKIPNLHTYGATREERLFNVALQLNITWMNRVLFLKLMEAQLIKYHKGDKSYSFMSSENIPNFSELNKLFFQVLARQQSERSEAIQQKYGHIPYLNSSLFEVSDLEDDTIRVSNLFPGLELPLFSATVLKDKKNKPKYPQLPSLRYLLEFLDAYDFASEGTEGVQEESKTLINASVLGLIFEKINGHKDGSVFTPGFITMYMCREAIRRVVIQKFNEVFEWNCQTWNDLYNKDISNIDRANEIINGIKLCDPAVGSGHFLVSALNEIIHAKYELGILADRQGKRIKPQDYIIEISNDELIVSDADGNPFEYIPGNPESQRIQEAMFHEKQTIIENCLFGVDINPNSVMICRLRLWIELLKNSYYTRDSNYTNLETLPNIDINIKCGNSLLYRFDVDTDIREILRQTGISIAEYKQAVADYKNAPNKEKKKEISRIISSIKSTLKTEVAKKDPKQATLNKKRRELSDIESPQLFEFTEKEIKALQKEAKKLKGEIIVLESYFEEIRTNKIYLGAFEWRLEFPEILNEDGEFAGFDLVIGNPPYIQLQKMGKEADALEMMSYKTYARTGDIYCLFYELGIDILKPNGWLSFITSNKWMRAGYGEAMRHYFIEHTNPVCLIDFAGYKVFDSATVDVNIMLAQKAPYAEQTLSCVIDKAEFRIEKMSEYCSRNLTSSSFQADSSWVVLSPIEKQLKEKIEKVGKPLKDWNVNIYRGILTGYNEAFIIDGATKDTLIAKSAKNAEIIRPILRGRDIKRYKADFADLWLLNIHNGTDTTPSIDINDYPEIKDHLDQFYPSLEARQDKGITPYNLRSCVYTDDFSKQKIVWADLARTGNAFTYDNTGAIVLNTCYILTTSTNDELQVKYLLALLNSKLILFYMNLISSKLDETGWRWFKQFVEILPIADALNNNDFSSIVDDIIISQTNSLEDKINQVIFDIYGLTEEEISFIELVL